MTGSIQPHSARTNIIQGIEVTWDRVADLFSLDAAVSHLNHGSFGAAPLPVQRSQHRLREEMEANPMAFFTRGIIDRLAHTRRHVAAFLGADPDGTALITNATAGMQLTLSALDPRSGDEILLTDHGYGTMGLAVRRKFAGTGATVAQAAIPLRATDDEVVEILTSAVKPGRTRFAVIDHITSPTAKLLPVARIVAALHDLDVVVAVDAAHAPGMLPVNVSAIGADFWFGNLHKWAFAPRATGVLVVAPRFRDRVQPLVVSWEQGNGFPSSVEYGGTLDYTGALAAPTGIHFLHTLDPVRVRTHNADLAAYGQRTLAAGLGVDREELTGSPGVSMRLVPLPPGSADDLASGDALRTRIAAELGAEVAICVWKGKGYLRLSGQIYNRPQEYDQLAEGLPALLRRHSTLLARPAA